MADHYPIRPITADEYARFRKVGAHAFHLTDDSEEQRARSARVFEPERSLAAFDARLPDDEAMVGTTFALSLRLTVPGAAVPAAGVTAVAVLPSHTRRGVLRSLMHRQLTDIAARGEEPVAALWAAETPIYARYGYGCATAHASFRFERGEGAMSAAAPADPALRLRLAEPATARPELAKVFEAVLAVQPGFYARNEDWWDRMLWDAPEDRGRKGQLRCLLAEGDSGTRGYALYTSRSHWDGRTGLPEGSLVIRELQASDPAAAAALWHNLLGRDLVTVVTAEDRSAEDPVLYQLLDPRRARAQVSDGLWVRIIDVPGALTRRAYSAPVDAVIAVTDPLLDGNTGRWRLRSAGQGLDATCERADEPADLALDVRELGAAYLGGTRLGSLAAAGLVSERRPGAVRRLSSALSWDPAPWCGQVF